VSRGVAALFLCLLAGGVRAEDPLRVLAASSLTEAFGEIAGAFVKAHPGPTVEISFAGSQVLRTQIEQGAPADVFASADLAQADALRQAGAITRYDVFARNTLVVAVPAKDAKVQDVRDLAKPGLKIVLAGPAVPAGLYALQVLARLSASGQYGDDFRSRVQANIVSEEPNVRLVLSKVALGEADAGFVYPTDVATTPAVKAVAIPEELNVTAEYPIAVVEKSAAVARARQFVGFVLGDEGQKILVKHGFRGSADSPEP
jgi:molybdate transport system substrate-binding protein